MIVKIAKAFCTNNTLKSTRTLIVPQKFATTPLEQYFHVTSQNYDFLTKANPTQCDQIFVLKTDSPSSLLRKNMIHIFDDSMTVQSVMQKFKAHQRYLEDSYKKSYEKCKTPFDVFHMERRIKGQIWNRCRLIGKVMGKYKHYNLFKSIHQIQAEKTLEQYKKNGVSVSILGKNKIFPTGPVWMPTSEGYLKLLQQYLSNNKMDSVKNILDLGCGSGILSFILGKQFKKAQIVAVDHNKHAVETCSNNAASLGLTNISSFQANITNVDDLSFRLKQNKAASSYDIIISNPPWLIGKRNPNESVILEGVYDNKGKHLKNEKSKFLLIYSDLSHNLGLTIKSIDELCKQNNMIIRSKMEMQYPKAIETQSPLCSYKQKSKIQLYEISKS